jgi:hypothetical protein
MPIPVKIATVTIDGVSYEGIYYVQHSMVCVESPFGTKATQVGTSLLRNSLPEAIAKILLSELVRASRLAPTRA